MVGALHLTDSALHSSSLNYPLFSFSCRSRGIVPSTTTIIPNEQRVPNRCLSRSLTILSTEFNSHGPLSGNWRVVNQGCLY